MTNVEKLLATVEDKDFYILHYRYLQLYVSLGLQVKKIHAGIIFKQGPIMKSYVDFNSEKRALAINKFDTDGFWRQRRAHVVFTKWYLSVYHLGM